MTQRANTPAGGVGLAEMATRHADLILKASGSALRHYTMPSSKAAIQLAALNGIEEAYRAGAEFALAETKALRGAAPALLSALEMLLNDYILIAEENGLGLIGSDRDPEVVRARAAIAAARSEVGK